MENRSASALLSEELQRRFEELVRKSYGQKSEEEIGEFEELRRQFEELLRQFEELLRNADRDINEFPAKDRLIADLFHKHENMLYMSIVSRYWLHSIMKPPSQSRLDNSDSKVNALAVLMIHKGVDAWNQWRAENPNVIPDLGRASLRGAYLARANLRGANLEKSDLAGAILIQADLQGARLDGANLAGANCRLANFQRASLVETMMRSTRFDGTDLRKAELTECDLSEANLRRADLSKSRLTSVDLSYSDLIETNLEYANLLDCRVYAASVWGVNLQGATQSNLVITAIDEPTITVDDLEVAQFIYLLLNNEKIRDVIDTVARKVVLILGRFTPERKAVLEAIREELRKRDYVPVLFDFDKPAARNITETVRTLAHLSRFIIADLTDPSSIPQELYAIIPTLAVPVQPVIEQGNRAYSMFVDLGTTYHWVLPIHEYQSTNDLLASLGSAVIAPAEAKAKELEKR